jgi:predicted protein tyrosine phosphatase
MNGLEHESFASALALEEEREHQLPERLRFARPYSYFSRGLYADLLRPYMHRFPREQILVVRFEDIIGRPGELAAQVHQFLGIAQRPGDAVSLGVINPSEADDVPLDDGLRRELVARYAEPNQRLAALLGPDFLGWD